MNYLRFNLSRPLTQTYFLNFLRLSSSNGPVIKSLCEPESPQYKVI